MGPGRALEALLDWTSFTEYPQYPEDWVGAGRGAPESVATVVSRF